MEEEGAKVDIEKMDLLWIMTVWDLYELAERQETLQMDRRMIRFLLHIFTQETPEI